MEFLKWKAKSVRADIANGELTISFSMAINDDNLEAAYVLGAYLSMKDGGEVEVRIIPRQLPLKGMFPAQAELVTEETKKEGQTTEEDDA
jgi:hypothetical protein